MTRPAHIVLLHGALGTQAQFDRLRPRLGSYFLTHALNFEGHGDLPGDRPFRVEHFAENVLAYLDAHGIEQAHLFGYSMGGYVGLYLALKHPARVSSLFTLATKFLWTPEAAARETVLLDPDRMLAKVPAFAEQLEAVHSGAGWRTVLEKTRDLLTALGEQPVMTLDDLKAITQRVRIGVGDRDNLVSVEESAAVYRALPAGELQVFPSTPHPLDKVSMELLAGAVVGFFGSGE